MKIIITKRHLTLIKEQSTFRDNETTDRLNNGIEKLTDTIGKIKEYTIKVRIGNGKYVEKKYYYLGGGESMFDNNYKTSEVKDKIYSPKECSNAVKLYNKKLETNKYYTDLLTGVGFSSPESLSMYLKKIEKLTYQEQEKWFNSPVGMKINKMKNNLYMADGRQFDFFSLKEGQTYKNLKGVHRVNGEDLKPEKFVFINVDEGGVWFYPVFEPRVPKCLESSEKAIPKIKLLKKRFEDEKLKNKKDISTQTEPKITPEKLKSEPTFTKEKPSITPTNFVVQWQENGKQKIKFYPDFNSWENFVNSIFGITSISRTEQKDKSSASITYGSNPANLKADGSYVSNNKLYN